MHHAFNIAFTFTTLLNYRVFMAHKGESLFRTIDEAIESETKEEPCSQALSKDCSKSARFRN